MLGKIMLVLKKNIINGNEEYLMELSKEKFEKFTEEQINMIKL